MRLTNELIERVQSTYFAQGGGYVVYNINMKLDISKLYKRAQT